MTPGPADPSRPRCSTAARERGDALAGTASTVRSFLLLEEPGPWGVHALRDARLPEGLGVELLRRCTRAGVRPLLIRRDAARPHTRPTGPPQITSRRVFAAHATATGGWLETATITDAEEVLDLDLAAIASGAGGLMPRTSEPVFAVCTHGRHDVCCAERGRPVLRALAAVEPEATWAVSHIGGDRFAANLLVLGEGLYYGGVDDESVATVARTHRDGRLDLAHLRGRSCWPMPVQAAEIALRQHLDEDRRGSVSLDGRPRTDPAGAVTATFAVADHIWSVTVRPEHGEPAALTCSSLRLEPAVRWRLVRVEPIPQT